MLLLPEGLMKAVVDYILNSTPKKYTTIESYNLAVQLEQLKVHEDKPMEDKKEAKVKGK